MLNRLREESLRSSTEAKALIVVLRQHRGTERHELVIDDAGRHMLTGPTFRAFLVEHLARVSHRGGAVESENERTDSISSSDAYRLIAAARQEQRRVGSLHRTRKNRVLRATASRLDGDEVAVPR